jgi:hypothetical protein
MWLLGRLAPDHKTIANFRSQSSQALVAACAEFIQFARRERLIAGAIVAIDGSKIRAVASRKAICDATDLIPERLALQTQLSQYLTQLDQSDSKLSVVTEPQAQAMKSLHGAPDYNLQSGVDAHSHLIVHHESSLNFYMSALKA